jgi:hypothetical protein
LIESEEFYYPVADKVRPTGTRSVQSSMGIVAGIFVEELKNFPSNLLRNVITLLL